MTRARPRCTPAASCPIYEGAGKLTTRILRTLIHRILQARRRRWKTRCRRIPARPPEAAGPLDRASATSTFPPPETDLRLLNAFRSPAQFRLIFEEFFWLECGVALKRSKARAVPGIAFELNDRVREQIKSHAAVQAHRRAEARAQGDRARTWRRRIP